VLSTGFNWPEIGASANLWNYALHGDSLESFTVAKSRALRSSAKAFRLHQTHVCILINDPSSSPWRETFEARPARAPRPKKRERPAKKKPRFVRRHVEGASSKANGKWRSSMFPGREFDDLDAYRAAKKQRAARREEYSARIRENTRGYPW